jgi:hypothetical protein
MAHEPGDAHESGGPDRGGWPTVDFRPFILVCEAGNRNPCTEADLSLRTQDPSSRQPSARI